ncbi:MAG: amidohydrolase family protein [Jatrophihabitans sp.]
MPAFWTGLGLDGLVDIHTHFMPDRVMDAVWRHFDNGAENYGQPWPIHYRHPVVERLEILDRLGVRVFTPLLYPHRPDMAESLSAWARAFAAETPGCVPGGTFYPEPSAARYVREALDAGTRVFKAHVQVGAYDPRDAWLDPVWGLLAEAGTPVVVHCGSGPVPGLHTGPGPFADVLARHPHLTAVIAHCGAPEYEQHLELVRRYPNVHVDTTMVGTRYLDALAPISTETIAALGDLSDRVVLGTDFPNIPYSYAEQLAALQAWGHGDDWLRAVCWSNGARLLGVG